MDHGLGAVDNCWLRMCGVSLSNLGGCEAVSQIQVCVEKHMVLKAPAACTVYAIRRAWEYVVSARCAWAANLTGRLVADECE